jgi:hypothetical protein
MIRILFITVMFGWVSGCQSISAQDFFDLTMNSEIGKSIASSWYRDPDEKKSLGDGKYEYIIRSKRSACVWAFVVDENEGLIQSWHYISAPSVCRLQTIAPW